MDFASVFCRSCLAIAISRWDGEKQIVTNTIDSPPDAGGCLVLVIEDNADGRDAMCRLLRSLGHRVANAADGMDGVAQTFLLRPDLVLVDLGLPVWDGFVVCERIRASLGNSIRVVACTAYGDAQSREQATAAGFDGYLVKPVSIADILPILASAPGSALCPRPER
jgi:CheY-like chemotaxis protein